MVRIVVFGFSFGYVGRVSVFHHVKRTTHGWEVSEKIKEEGFHFK
jgi:hypothetical protein